MAVIDKVIDISINRSSYRNKGQALLDAIYAAVGDEPNPTRWALEGFPMEQISLIVTPKPKNPDYLFFFKDFIN